MVAKLGVVLIWLAVFDAIFIMTLANPNEIVPLSTGGAICAVLGLFLLITGSKK